ncbi:hypothetical protein [Chitinophaga ginsengisoli]|uniref:Uncharacterized protein n=1 Tax=Chitinophaga ginsengisoli TaxID=363837 RepID=A0A2P8FQ22_9BACT|nr:hypothetical protein [Chitinophaga ginsengisoli]PSL23797.1 hypothetical protein CLV42_117155 [Chitinophaga ginsengisoli]
MKYEQIAPANISEQEKIYRTFISNDPVLSYFLATGSIPPNARFVKEAIYTDIGFLAFISPYFKEVYVQAIRAAFALKDINLMSDVAANPMLLNTAYRMQAFDELLADLEEKKTKLAAMHHKLVMYDPLEFGDLLAYTDASTISNMNYLPVEFLEFRSAYAALVVKVIRALVNRDLPTSLTMVCNLCELTVDMPTLQDVHALCKLIHEADNEQKGMECDRERLSRYISSLGRRHRYDSWP